MYEHDLLRMYYYINTVTVQIFMKYLNYERFKNIFFRLASYKDFEDVKLQIGIDIL